MKTLIITAHPSSQGFTHSIAQQYKGTKKTQGGEVKIIDLYDEKFSQDFLRYEKKSELQSCKKEIKNSQTSAENTEAEDSEENQKSSECQYLSQMNDGVQKIIQEKISWADELVFVFPLWWGDMPAIMKNFIDINFSSGFAFEFEKGKSTPKKLLIGKTAQVFITCDAPKIYYWWKNYPFLTILKDFVLGFCGIETKNTTIFSSMIKRSEKEKNKFLEVVTKVALK